MRSSENVCNVGHGAWGMGPKSMGHWAEDHTSLRLRKAITIAGLIVGIRHCRVLIRLDSRGELKVKMNKTNNKIYV